MVETDGPPEAVTPNPGIGNKTPTAAEVAKQYHAPKNQTNDLQGNQGPNPIGWAEQQRDLGLLKGSGQMKGPKHEDPEARDPTDAGNGGEDEAVCTCGEACGSAGEEDPTGTHKQQAPALTIRRNHQGGTQGSSRRLHIRPQTELWEKGTPTNSHI